MNLEGEIGNARSHSVDSYEFSFKRSLSLENYHNFMPLKLLLFIYFLLIVF